MKIVSLILIAVAIVGLIYNGINAILGPDMLKAARRENQALKARRDALREEALALESRARELFEPGGLLAPHSDIDRGWHAARLGPPPAPSASNEQVIAWMTRHGAALEALAIELSSGDERPTLQPEPRHRLQPGIDHEIKKVRGLEFPLDMDNNLADRRNRQTGD